MTSRLARTNILVGALFSLSAFATSSAPASSAAPVDLVCHEPYTVTSLVPIRYSFAASERKYYRAGALTDGKKGSSANYKDGRWQGFNHGGNRSVVIDMGRVNTVKGMQERFFQDCGDGIYFPREVDFALSLNGKDWSFVGKVSSKRSLTIRKIETQTYKVSGLDYRARYVMMTFTVDVWVFADEFQVFGSKGVEASAKAPKPGPSIAYPDAYLRPGSPEVGGIRNMVLIYNGYYPSDPASGKNTVNQLTPYVGYKTRSGKIEDFMFDGFLFLPFVAAGAPSGGKYYCSTPHPAVMSDWLYYINNTFDESNNLGALNIATGNVKRILNDTGYKAKVEIAIPYPSPAATNFGDIHGDGKSENLSLLPDREAVIRWYVNQVMKRWNAAKYTNLKLVGFYWYEEAADFSVDDSEAQMLRYAGDYIRSLGKVLDWIPYYQAPGFVEWHSLGFDGAIMQPNYAFDKFPEKELGEAAAASRKLGMGVELEIHWDATRDPIYREKYYAYLNYGVSTDYMKAAVHAFYQNGGPGTFYNCCESSNPAIREIYDQTYKFIKGTYVPYFPGRERATSRELK